MQDANKSGAPDLTTSVSRMGLEPLIEANQRGLAAMVEAQEHVLKRVTEIGSEMFQFADRRMAQDSETLNGLAACKSPLDAAQICGKFYETAMQQYFEEAGKLAGMCAVQAPEAIEDVLHVAEETTAPVLKGD